MVTVTSEKESAGTLHLLFPCCDIVRGHLPFTIGCLLTDAIPIDKKVIKWNDVENNKARQLTTIGKDISAVTSFMTISSSDWKNNKFTCSIGDMKKNLIEVCTEVKVSQPDTEIYLASYENSKQLSIVPIVCLVSSFYPNDTTVVWLKNGLHHTNSNFNTWKGEDGLFFGKSTLNISRESWLNNDEYTCKVTLEKLSHMKNISKCSACQDSFVTPVVDLQLPSNEDLLYNNGTIICSFLGINLDSSQMFLKFDSKITQKTGTPTKEGNTVRLAYKVSREEWKTIKQVSCGMKQPCSLSDLEKVINVDAAVKEPKQPSVQLLAASCYDNMAQSPVLLLCIISDFWPQDASVIWLKNGNPHKDRGTPLIPMKDGTGMYSGNSMLNVTRDSWNTEDTYTCQVTHYNKNIQQEKICKSKVPDGDILKPSFKDLFHYKNATVSCKINVDDTKMQLLMNGLPKKSTQAQIKHNNVTWKQITAQVTLEEWNTTTNVSCILQPPQAALQRKLSIIRINTEEMKVPVVYLLPPAHESVIMEDLLTLVCLVQDYYPEDLFVTWSINDSLNMQNVTSSSSANCNSNTKRCSTTSQLTVLKSEWIRGTSYSCLVAHISSDEFIRRKISAPLNKSENSLVKPEHYILKPDFKELFLSKTATVKCATNILSNDIRWLMNGIEMNTSWQIHKEQILHNNSTWAQSTIQIPLEEWKNISELSCKLNNSQELQLTNPNVTKQPKIYVLPPATESQADEEQLTLVCLVKGFYPEDLFVTWKSNDSIIKEDVPDPKYVLCDLTNQLCSFVSQVSIPKEQWLGGMGYECRVAHISSKDYFSKHISKHNVPDGDILKPSFKDLFHYKNATVSCKINVDDTKMQLLMNGLPKKSTQAQIKHNNVTWKQITAQVTLEEWNTTTNVSCILQPPQAALQKKLSIIRINKAEEMKVPVVYLLPPAHESVIMEDLLTLVCLVQDYYPEDLFVTWSINDSLNMQNVTSSSSANCNSNTKRCSTTSQLTVLKSEWIRGTSYSCLVAHISSDEFIRRKISAPLNKSENSLVKPEHYILKPDFKELFLSKTATVKCATNILSNDIRWLMNGIEMNTSWQIHKEQILHNNSTWAQSTIQIPLEEWKNISELSCKLNNSQELQLTNPNVTKQPKIYVLPPATESQADEEQLTLVCLVKGFYPEDLFVTWKSNDSIIKEDVPDPKYVLCDLTNQLCSFVSQVSIPKEQWLGGIGYECRVAHISSKDYFSKHISKHNVPDGDILKPSFKDLFHYKNATVSCKINVDDTKMQLLMNGLPKKSTRAQIKHNNVTWKQITAQVTLEEWNTTTNVSCILQPPQAALQRKLSIIRINKAEEMKVPVVYLLPPAHESVIMEDLLTLVCLVQDYYPEDLFVTWSINDSLNMQNVTSSSSANCNSNTKRCSTTSQLTVLKSEWIRGTSYSCLVAHISSDEFIRRKISAPLNKSENSLVKPENYILKPDFKELFLSKTATVKCATNILSNDIRWLMNGIEMNTSWQIHKEQILHKNSTWAQSTIQIPLEEWKNISELSCKLNNSQELQLTNPNVTKQPKIYVLPPTTESQADEEQLTLVCLVKGFYPEDLFVTWKSNDTIINENVPDPKYVLCDLKNQLCSFVSQVSIPKEQWLGGMGYECRVAHISSKDYFSKHISKHNDGCSPTGISTVYQDVVEDLSESEDISNVWTTASTFIALFLLTLIYSSFVTFIKVK
ncbi:uncharacterized protein LOC134891479 isoform X3 [Pseudophryne corroboree]|uniref:uncharacterized protein LOC134891479 isoform X3 n=1 Tax=Pseudophryne corroboree TaxID=495146 RepID=UPI00308209CA